MIDRPVAWMTGCGMLIVFLTASIRAESNGEVPPPGDQGPRLTLDDCIAIALRSQPAIKAQRGALGAAAERQRIARSFFLPQVGFETRYTHLDEPRTVDLPSPFTGVLGDVFTDSAAYFGIARLAGSAAANAALDSPNTPPFSVAKQAALDALPDTFSVGLLGENSLTTEFLLTQPLWTGGKISYRHQQARLGVQAASADVAKSRQQTVFDVCRAYLGIQYAGELTRVTHEIREHLRAIESLVQALLDEGNQYVTMVDLRRVRTIRLLAEGEQVGAERAADLAHEALRQAMGLEPSDHFEIAEDKLIAFGGDVDLPATLDDAMARRPELAKTRIAVRIAELERKLARSEYLPDVGLFGRLGTIDDDGGFPNPNDRQEWAVGVRLGVPLYAGGRRTAQTRRAEFLQAEARQTQQLARQLIALEVQKVYLEYLEASQRLPRARAAADEADQTVDLYWDQFRGDQIEDEEMPDFFEDLTAAEVLRGRTKAEYYGVVYQNNLSLARIKLVAASHDYSSPFRDSAAGAVGSDAAEDRTSGRGAASAEDLPLLEPYGGR